MLAQRLSFPVLGLALLAAGNWQSAQAQELAVSPFQLSVNFQRNTTSGNAVSRSLEVTGINSDVTVTTTTDGPANVNWLFVNPTFMAATGGATRRVDVTLLPAPLAAGNYTGKIRFAPATGAAVEVNVALLVSDTRLQNAVPSALQFVAQRGASQAPATPISITVTSGSLTVAGAGSSSPTGWLVVDPLPVNTPGSVSVSVNPAGLVPGDYVGSITVNASTLGEAVGNPSIVIPVRLKVVDDSRLTVAPSSISVDHQVNSANPAPRTISIGSTGSALAFTTEVATPGSGTPWMAVTPTSGNTPQSLTVNFQNLASLQAGTYNGTITVRVGSAQSQVVNVTLRVATDPLLTAAPSQLTFTFQQGGPLPPRQTVVLSNFGNPVAITAAAQGTATQWLTVTPAASNTPSALVVGINPSNLQTGIFDGNIEVRGAIGNSPYLIPVRMIVSPPAQPLLRVAQNFLNFAFQTGGSATSLSQTLNVTSTGSAAITYGALSVGGAGWLTASPSGTQTTPSNLTVTVTPGSLPPGVYAAQVSVQSTEQGATPIVVPVRLVISTQPLISVNPSSLAFTTNTTGTPQRQTIAVNSTGTNFPYTAAATVAGGGNWLVIAPGQTTGSTIEVGVNQVVTEGSGLITITAPTAENSPVLVPVTLTTPGSTGGGTVSNLTVTPNQLDFTAVIGSTPPAAQTLDVSVGSTSTLVRYTIGEIRYLTAGGWLKLNKPTGGIAPDRLEVSVDASALQAGRYAATIPFTSDVGNRDVVVFLEVRRVVTGFAVSPEALTFNFTPGNAVPVAQAVQVTSTGDAIAFVPEVRYAVAPAAPWLSIQSTSGSTPATISATVNPAGLTAGTYQATINLTGQNGALTRAINVTLTVAAGATPTVTRVVNAASNLDTQLVPGLIVSLYGTNLGPTAGVAASPNSTGLYDRQLGNVRVLFDTFEAPILFVSANQINAIVPYAVGTRVSVPVRVEVNGVRSAPVEIRVGLAAPAIFQLSAAGQGAILNQDSTVNSAINAAARDSVVVLFATGEGETNPPGTDGAIPGRSTALKTPRQRVRVRIGGQEAEVLYAGSAPFLVSGVLQVNAKVPAGVTPGPAVPIELIVGDTASASGVTVAVR